MTKELQDLSWKCLPSEAREYIRTIYHNGDSLKSTIDDLFGEHNLISEIEPQEMIMVNRDDIILSQINNEKGRRSCFYGDDGSIGYWKGRYKMLEDLFGDKCLPYEKQYPVFKYQVGDLVTYNGKIKKVISRYSDGGRNMYYVSLQNGQSQLYLEESRLKPYIEELDIFEILKNHQDIKTIYSVAHDSEVGFDLRNRYIEIQGSIFYYDGSMYEVIGGRCILYPTRELYQKYPLSPIEAWEEWKKK